MNKESYHFAGDGRPAGRTAPATSQGAPASVANSPFRLRREVLFRTVAPLVKGGERPKRESNAAPLVGSVMVLLGTLLLLDDCHAPLGGKAS